MSCGDQNYFVGNGKVWLRKRADDCGDPSEGWWEIGDADSLSISTSQDFGDHFESQTGNKIRAARWVNQTTTDFTLSVQNFSVKNLAVLTQGVDSGVVPPAAIVGETVEFAYEGQTVFTAYPGMSAVSILEGATPLVLDTDYTLETRTGGISIITGAPNVSGPGPITLTVDYTHVGIKGLVEGLTGGIEDYQIRFNGINRTATDVPVIVEIKRAQINAAEELGLISNEVFNLSFTGAVLPDENNEFYNILHSNAVV